MKTLPKHYQYFYFFLILAPLGVALILLFPQQVANSFLIHQLFFWLAIILAISPLGGLRLGNKEQCVPFWRWLLWLFIAEAGVAFTYLGFTFVVFKGIPVLNVPDISTMQSLLKTFAITDAVFPYAIFTLVAITLAYIGFKLGKPGRFSVALQPLMKNKTDDAISLTTDFLIRVAVYFMLAALIGILELIFISFLAQFFSVPIISGLKLGSFIIATIILIGINIDPWKKSVRYLSTHHFPLALIAIVFAALIAIAVVILNAMLPMIPTNMFPVNHTILNFAIPQWTTHWQILSSIWWIGWTPLIAGLIAFLSRGYQIRTVIFSNLLIGILITTLLWLLQRFLLLNGILGIIGAIMLLSLFMQKRFVVYQMRGTVPQTHIEKQRSWHLFIHVILQTSAYTFILYLPLGIYTLSIYYFFMLLPLALLSLMTCITLLLFWLRKPTS